MNRIAVPLAMIGFLAGCATPASRPAAGPVRFPHCDPRPVAVVLKTVEAPNERREPDANRFVYPQVSAAAQVHELGTYLADQVGLRGGIRSHRLASDPTDIRPGELVFRITLSRWYARWPVQLPTGKPDLVVDGSCDFRFDVLSGERLLVSQAVSTGGAVYVANTCGITNLPAFAADAVVGKMRLARDAAAECVITNLVSRWSDIRATAGPSAGPR